MVKEFFSWDYKGFVMVKVGFAEGKFFASASLNSDAVVDFVVDAAEKAIPGDFDKPLLEVVRASAKAALARV
jgi:hypothetical protein